MMDCENQDPNRESPDKNMLPCGGGKKSWLVVAASAFVLIGLAALVLLGILGMVMWQLGIFSPTPMGITARGFSKIMPHISSTEYASNGEFTSIFTNAVGRDIIIYENLLNVSTTDRIPCRSAKIDTEEISSGQNFKLTASGCPPGMVGDMFSIYVEIPYEQMVGETKTKRTASGIIRGPIG